MAKKNKASDTIKRATPKFIPFCTARVWSPKYVPSLIMSLNHKPIAYIKFHKFNIRKYTAIWNPCILKTKEVVKFNKQKLVKIGQGEGETKWKGWFWKLLFDL